jgi:hypothetical protein
LVYGASGDALHDDDVHDGVALEVTEDEENGVGDEPLPDEEEVEVVH